MAADAPGSPREAATTPDDWTWLARIRRPQGRKGEVFADLLTDFPDKFAQRRRLWLLSEKPHAAALKGHNFSRTASTAGSSPASKKDQQASALKGHDFSRAASTSAEVKGTGFSPYINPAKSAGALATEGTAPREVELIAHWLHKGGVVLHFAGIDSISAAETLKGMIVALPRSERVPLAEDEVYIGDLIGCTLADVAGAAPVIVGIIGDVDRTAGPVALLAVQAGTGEILIPFAKSYLRKIDLAAKRVEMALPDGLVDLNASTQSVSPSFPKVSDKLGNR